MKKSIINEGFISMLYLFLFFTQITYAQTQDVMCGTPTFTTPETLPIPMGPGNPTTKYLKVAIVYVDFPDGRVDDNQQVFTMDQLNSIIGNSGKDVDAVAELGIEGQGNNKYLFPAHYTYDNRWDMYFDSLGYYNSFNGNPGAHPDYITFGRNAYGSLKEYYSEVSNEKLRLVPAITHGSGQNKFETGIINNYQIIDGNRKIIKSLMLPKNKYGNGSNAYFGTKGSTPNQYHNVLVVDAYNRIKNAYPDEINFNISDPANNDIVVIIVFAGSNGSIGGQYYEIGGQISFDCPVITARGFENLFYDTTKWNWMDGIRIQAHELGHYLYGPYHTNAGRYCVMNPSSGASHPDCPPHCNPYFKLINGWVNANQYDNSGQINNIPPIETSKQCGIVTIYGKPNASQNFQTGEYLIFENRRKTGFDRFIVPPDNQQNELFKGGMLIWHYSPYYKPDIVDYDPSKFQNLKIEIPLEVYPILNLGYYSIEHFWGYIGSAHYDLGANRTHSKNDIYTGIALNNIHSVENTTTSNMYFNLNYTVAEPVHYDYVIFNRGGADHVENLSGNIYYHGRDDHEYYTVEPNTILESFNNSFDFMGMKTNSTPNSLVTFRGAGYRNANESYILNIGTISLRHKTFGEVDKLVFENVKIENAIASENKVIVPTNTTNTSCEISNIIVDTDFSNEEVNKADLIIQYANINKLQVNNMRVFAFGCTNYSSTYLNNCLFILGGTNNVSPDCTIIARYSKIKNYGTSTILQGVNSQNWGGLILIGAGSSIILDGGSTKNVTIKDGDFGIYLFEINNELSITNCHFQNKSSDIIVDNYVNASKYNELIKDNTFTPSSSTLNTHIIVRNTNHLNIIENTFTDVNATGIYLTNCNMPLIANNIITGIGNYSHGIFSYKSNGTYKCNDISQCYFGVALNNSQPVLYQNYIHHNGIGMYVTNNSQPIMTPARTDDHTIILAGFNTFQENSGYEINIDNTINASNYIFMDNGNNDIEDNVNNNDYLMYINNEGGGEQEIIQCTNNYWGTGNDPGNKFYPVEYFNYNPWLTQLPAPPSNCQIVTTNQDNSSLSPQTLLMGNILNSNINKDYSLASSFSNQLANTNGLKSYKKSGSRLYYANKYLEETEIPTLTNYFTNMMGNYSNDTAIYKHLRNLKIESEVINSELTSALNIVDSIILHPGNSYELFYAYVEKLRILNMIDSNISGGGDNPLLNNNNQFKNNVGNEIDRIFKTDLYKITGNKILKDKKNTKGLENKNVMDSRFESFLKNAKQNIQYTESNNDFTKKEIVNRKIMYELMVNNYVPGVPPIDLNHKSSRNNALTETPKKFSLSQNYPNPFNPVTKINYDLPKDGKVKLVIYDILGREVKILVDNELKRAGQYTVEFNGDYLASGIYFYRIQVEDGKSFTSVKKMVFVK